MHIIINYSKSEICFFGLLKTIFMHQNTELIFMIVVLGIILYLFKKKIDSSIWIPSHKRKEKEKQEKHSATIPELVWFKTLTLLNTITELVILLERLQQFAKYLQQSSTCQLVAIININLSSIRPRSQNSIMCLWWMDNFSAVVWKNPLIVSCKCCSIYPEKLIKKNGAYQLNFGKSTSKLIASRNEWK